MARLLSSYCANRSNCIILGNEAKRFLGRQKYEQVDIFFSSFWCRFSDRFTNLYRCSFSSHTTHLILIFLRRPFSFLYVALPVLADRLLNRNFYRWNLIRCSIEFAFG